MRDDQRRLVMNMVFIGIPLMFLLLPVTQPYMIVSLGVAFHGVLWFLDCVSGAHIAPIPPYAMWTVVGAVIGCVLGYWTIAPSLGKRHMRRVAVLIPFIVLGGLTLVDVSYSLLNPTPPAQTRPPTNPPGTTIGGHVEPGPTDPTIPHTGNAVPITTASTTGGAPAATTP